MLELDGRKVIVLGLGDTGLSMARWVAARGARVTVSRAPDWAKMKGDACWLQLKPPRLSFYTHNSGC